MTITNKGVEKAELTPERTKCAEGYLLVATSPSHPPGGSARRDAA
jgi:hypothetical protein